MTRLLTVAGYAVIVLALAAHHWAQWRCRRAAPLTRIVTWLVVSTPTRWLFLAAWLWLGWHLFARVGRP